MFFRLLLLLIVVPFVELTILLMLSSKMGWEWTLALVILTGILGAWLARQQGFSTWFRIQEEMARGKMPRDSLADALMIFLAGALLLTPGLLTDLFGFSLLLPPCRRVYKQGLMRQLKGKFHFTSSADERRGDASQGSGDQIIDSYVIPSNENDQEPKQE